MKSKTSLFNTGIQKQNFKQYGWIGIVYLVGLLFSLPMQMILYASDEHRGVINNPIDHFFEIGFPPQLFFLLMAPVIAGIFLFRYIQVSSSADMMHSLPVKRNTLFLNQLISGFVMLLLPVWITALLASIVANAYPVFENISSADIWDWITAMSVMTIFYFGFSVFVAMVTGLSVAQGILTIILLILPAGLFHLIYENINFFLYGFSPSYYSNESITRWSPIFMMGEWNFNDVTTGEILLYFILAVVFVAVAHVLYKLRHTEMATQAITFQPLRPIFKYGVSFCAMLVGGVYFQQYDSSGWLIFGYVFGSLLGYLIAEMILKKTWRIWSGKTFIRYAGYAIVMIILAVIVKTDMIGYASHIPEDDQIKGVYFGHSVYPLITEETEQKAVFTSNKEYIQSVKDFHLEIVEEKPEEVEGFRSSREYVVAYQLEDGKKVVRHYRLSADRMTDALAKVMESEAYKRERFHLSQLEQPLDEIEIRPYGPVQKKAVITDQQEIDEFRNILKYEIASMTIEEILEERKSWGSITAEPANAREDDHETNRPTFQWRKSFDELEKWLTDNGYLDQARVLPEDIETAEIIRIDGGINSYDHPSHIFMELNSRRIEQAVEIDDKDMIEEALEQYREYGNGEYIIRFRTVNRGELHGVFEKNELPEVIRSKFKE